MKEYNSLNSFGEVLSEIISDRGIGSDELLARKAMRVQDRQSKRINVQRKTINNWRNNRSMPRSITDRQFQLVLTALDVNEQELSALIRFIDASSNRQVENATEKVTVPTIQPRWILTTALGVLAISLVLLLALFLFDAAHNEHLSEIPSGELSLSKDGYIIPSSNTEKVTTSQLEKLTGWELYVARNEIFARHGWEFSRASSLCLQHHFDKFTKSKNSTQGWYQRLVRRKSPSNLESSNAETIRAYECSVRGGQFNCNGRLNQCR